MATITKSIGTSSRDYSTMTSWEADLDNAAVYASGDDAVGECYNDSVFDEAIAVDGGGTVGLNSVTLTGAPDERHDGTAGTGARIVRQTAVTESIVSVRGGTSRRAQVCWLEIDGNQLTPRNPYGITLGVPLAACCRLVVHGIHSNGAGSLVVGIFGSHNTTTTGDFISNSIVYDIDGKGTANGDDAFGVRFSTSRTRRLYNVTVHNVRTYSNSDPACGIDFPDSSLVTIKNCVVTDITNQGTNAKICFSNSTPIAAVVDYCASSDATAPGTGSVRNIVSSAQYVSTTVGSEDLHLKKGSDCIQAGANLTGEFSYVELDIDGQTRPSEGAWDIGADHSFLEAVLRGIAVYGANLWRLGQPRTRGLFRRG